MNPWNERVLVALEDPPKVLYHATTLRKLARYEQTGAILPPVRGFDALAAAEEWARLTQGRSIILRIEVEHSQALPDHHNSIGLAWWTPVKVEKWSRMK